MPTKRTDLGVTDENILSATQGATADERNRTRNFSKTSSKVNRIVGNPAGKEFDS